MNRGKLIVLSGPSGTGKGTIVKNILARDKEAELSISMTTREKREGETHGREYFFVDRPAFEETIASDGFLEWADVYGNYYGTPKAYVEERLAAGKDVILEIDVQGGRNIKAILPEAVLIFILPPSLAELRRRLEHRGTDAPEVIEKRMQKAAGEIAVAAEYDFAVINEDKEVATDQVMTIMKAAHHMVGDDIRRKIGEYKEEA